MNPKNSFFAPMSFELGDFLRAAPSLDAARARLQHAYACGAILMLEKTFQDFPLLARIDFATDYEGWHSTYAMLRRPGGELAWSNDVMMALCRLEELALAGSPYDPAAPDDESDYLNPALGLEFSGLERDLVRDMEDSASDGLSYFHRFAPDVFADCMDRSTDRKAAIEPADAQGIARQLGLHEMAANFERARLQAHAAQGAIPKASPSL